MNQCMLPKRLQQQIKLCEYDHEFDETMFVDHFMFRLHLESMQESLSKEGRDLTIVSTLKVTETEEAATRQLEAIHTSTETATMHMIRNKNTRNCR